MRFSLINPGWSFEGSIYFGCREPHLPLEYGYSKALLEKAGHEAQIVDVLHKDAVRNVLNDRGQELFGAPHLFLGLLALSNILGNAQ